MPRKKKKETKLQKMLREEITKAKDRIRKNKVLSELITLDITKLPKNPRQAIEALKKISIKNVPKHTRDTAPDLSKLPKAVQMTYGDLSAKQYSAYKKAFDIANKHRMAWGFQPYEFRPFENQYATIEQRIARMRESSTPKVLKNRLKSNIKNVKHAFEQIVFKIFVEVEELTDMHNDILTAQRIIDRMSDAEMIRMFQMAKNIGDADYSAIDSLFEYNYEEQNADLELIDLIITHFGHHLPNRK